MSRPEPRLGNPKNTIENFWQKIQICISEKFGQNFLIDEHVLDKIISAAGIGSDEFCSGDRTGNRDDDSVSGICSARCCCRGDR